MLTASVVRPKTPRGTRTRDFRERTYEKSPVASSDPNPARGRELEAGLLIQDRLGALVVRPKTPRGTRTCTPAEWFRTRSSGRQTQNPARGRELPRRHRRTSVVLFVSSDPKPREGREPRGSHRPRVMHLVVRPKTPRGTRTTEEPSIPKCPSHCVVRPKTPRGDENSSGAWMVMLTQSVSPSRQTQNPARGREPDWGF